MVMPVVTPSTLKSYNPRLDLSSDDQNPLGFGVGGVPTPSAIPDSIPPVPDAKSYMSPAPPAPAPVPVQAPAAPPAQRATASPYVLPIGYGLSGAQNTLPTTDTTGGVVNVLANAGGAAAMGGASAGPMGALAAGGTALVLGGLNQWLATRNARAQERKQRALMKEAQARDDARYTQQRQDALEQQGYDRKAAALSAQWNAVLQRGQMLQQMMANNQSLRDRFRKYGYV